MISEATLVRLERLSVRRSSAPQAEVVGGLDAEPGDSFSQTDWDVARGEDGYVARDTGLTDTKDLDLVAAARTWLPELVAEVRRLRSVASSPQPIDGDEARWPTTTADRLTLIGYWAGPDTRGDWPSPEDFVDPGWDEDERSLVVDYLRQGQIARAYMGWSRCRLCGQNNGDLELTDGRYVWPSGLVHYVESHDVRLPQPFVTHAEARVGMLEEAQRDQEWWRSARPEPPTPAVPTDQTPPPDLALRERSGRALRALGDVPGIPAGQLHLLRVVDLLGEELSVEHAGRGGEDRLVGFLRSLGELLGGPERQDSSTGRLVPLDPWIVVADALRETSKRG